MKILALVSLVLGIAVVSLACAPNAMRYAQMSSGHVGCAPQQIEIQDLEEPWRILPITWTATCGGEKFFCSSTPTGQDYQTVCAPDRE